MAARKRKSAHTKLFVLDTNVLMHDPTSLFRFEEHDLFLPMMTLEELDNNKKGMSEVARNARQASRFIEELVAGGQERIIIPTAYRTDYLGALNAFSKNGQTSPLIRMLDVAQSYTGMIDWSDFERARTMLDETNAFAEGADAKLRIPAGALS